MSDDGIHDSIARRSFLKGAGAAGTAVATALGGALPAPAEAQTPPPAKDANPLPPAAEPLLTLTATEAAFLSAAYDTFIPPDRLSSSGTDCGLVAFIDRQLAGAWGSGAKLYRSGPFIKGTREQGYQLSLTPREFFAAGIKAANEWTRKTYGKDFDRLSAAQREAALEAMDAGKAEFAEVNGKQFFEMLLQSAMEGFFADPIYGGNRDKAGWLLIGFPGAPALHRDHVEKYRDKEFPADALGIADMS